MTQITDHLAEIRERISIALEAAGRGPADASLLAVSKQHGCAAIEAAWRAGQRDFGESFVQEALPKMEQLTHLDITWHFIGRIQANKTRAIAERFDWVHTLDRAKIALRLNGQRPAGAAALKVLLQVDLAGEAQKGGVRPEGVAELAAVVAAQPKLELRGLMSIPPAGDTLQERDARFASLAKLRDEMVGRGFAMPSLSMGMSDDFERAIGHGATWVRIGTAIFGRRPG